jgi:hypothetical protein
MVEFCAPRLMADEDNPPTKGYTPMTSASLNVDPEQEDDLYGDVTPKKHVSEMAENAAEKILLQKEAENDCLAYKDIVRNATVTEDIPNDCWGGLVFVVVTDLPDLRAGRAVMEGKIRFGFVLCTFIINVMIQGILLYFIGKLLMMPGILGTQNLYKDFHQRSFVDGTSNQDQFDAMPEVDKENLCGMALSQGLFVRVILFLWVTTNVGELRDNYAKTMGVVNLPRLPEGLDTRLMVRDLPTTETADFCVICLNLKGKVGLLVLVFIPKFIIAMLVTLEGCLWLMSAENIGDLILNSLALAFVVKVDELLAQVFYPQRLQKDLENLSLYLPSDPNDNDDELRSRKSSYEFIECAVVLCATLIIVEVMIVFQPVIPYYANDVTTMCMGFINSQVPWCMPWQKECFPRS